MILTLMWMVTLMSDGSCHPCVVCKQYVVCVSVHDAFLVRCLCSLCPVGCCQGPKTITL